MHFSNRNHGTRHTATLFACAISATVLTALAACERKEIKAYRAPKSETPIASVGSTSPAPSNPAANSSGNGKVTWSLQPAWKEVPTTQAMRVATIDANGVEISIAAFPGDVGGPLANVNRWRGQIGLAPITDAELPKLLTTSRVGDVEISLLTMTGSAGQVLLAASIVPGDGQTWFVKATSEPAKISAIQDAFFTFVTSFRLEAPANAAVTPPANTPPSAPSAPSAPPPATNAIAQRLGSTPPPPNWKPDANASSFLAASFTATNDKGTARATASSLLNDGGGLLANINRWRDQLGLASLATLAEQPVTNISSNAVLVDLVNAAGTDRQVIIVLTDNANGTAQTTTWFFKLRGTPDAVAAERSTFEAWAKALGGIQ